MRSLKLIPEFNGKVTEQFRRYEKAAEFVLSNVGLALLLIC